MPAWPELAEELKQLEAAGAFRRLRGFERREGPYVWLAGRRLLNLSSNDYLGLAGDPEWLRAFLAQAADAVDVDRSGLGATASRLLAGNHPGYQKLEENLARAYGREAALVASSGYHANCGLLPALAGPQDAVFSDRLNHASLWDGLRLSGAQSHRFRHRDYGHLESLLARHRGQARRALIVSESVFSMDGDRADLDALIALKTRWNARLILDEAHAVGVLGPTGLGLAEAQGRIADVDVLVGTFGKALAGFGAFLVSERELADYLVNKMRTLIFTTALPPLQVAWLDWMWSRRGEWAGRRERLAALAAGLRRSLQAEGLAVPGDTHIVPVTLGENEAAVRTAALLQAEGFWVLPIRPPTVPQGSARVRLSLTAAMDPADLERVPGLIRAAAA
ncbi:MAG: 8-amino-7-oxononanoate synthase [candidate division FCPU426 bacterium]